MRRVVITGCGIVSALGSDLESVWQRASSGQSGIGPLSKLRFDKADRSRHVAAEVKTFEPEKHFSAAQLSVMDRFAQFAVVAARAAQVDSGIEWNDEVSH